MTRDGIILRRPSGCKLQYIAVLVFLLCTMEMPLPTQARFESQISSNRSLQARSNVPSHEGLQIELLHVHHVDSPYGQPNPGWTERLKISAKRSKRRAQFISAQISGKIYSSRRGAMDVYSSNVIEPTGDLDYLMQISLGTPARTFVGVLDTGSDLVWVQCEPCTVCFIQPDPIFDGNTSTTYEALPCSNDGPCSAFDIRSRTCSISESCSYNYTYGSGGTQGNLASETLTLTSTNGTTQKFPNFAFGCSHASDGVQIGDGIFGLGLGSLSLVSQLDAQIQIENVFSYCLVGFINSDNKSSNLLLGSPGAIPLNYTPLVANPINPSFYYVNVTGISVGGLPIQYPADVFTIDSSGQGGTIVDSGTTITQLDSRVYVPFTDALKPLIQYHLFNGTIPYGYDVCFNVTNEELMNLSFPSVSFHLQDGVGLDLPYQNLIGEVDGDDSSTTICLLVQSTEGITILGNVLQQNYQIAFDRENRQVGFAFTTC